MKNKLLLILISLFCLSLAGCENENAQSDNDEYSADEEFEAASDIIPKETPSSATIKSLCEISALKCYYHNVAKGTKEPGTGLMHLGEKERNFWIEYTGIAEISYKANEMKIEQNDTEITITMPKPSITCSIDPDSWDINSYVTSDDNTLFQKNPITADDQTQVIDNAQKDMLNEVSSNAELINTAKKQAETTIENYINQIGDITNTQYTIIWKDSTSEDTVK